MKYIFFGTPEFAKIILEKLIVVFGKPELVVCNPDRPTGRKKIITSPPVKILAEKEGITFIQPETLKTKEVETRLKETKADLAIVAAYGKIIPKTILEIPHLGIIGVHPSLLPKYRGASPIQSTILAGEKETGVTLYLMDEKTDHGPILATKITPIIESDTYDALLKKFANVSSELLEETLPKIIEEEITPKVQNESEATFTQKFTSEDGYVDFKKDNPKTIERKIKALNPEPGVWTFGESLGSIVKVDPKKRVKLLAGRIEHGTIVLEKIQIEGKKPQSI